MEQAAVIQQQLQSFNSHYTQFTAARRHLLSRWYNSWDIWERPPAPAILDGVVHVLELPIKSKSASGSTVRHHQPVRQQNCVKRKQLIKQIMSNHCTPNESVSDETVS